MKIEDKWIEKDDVETFYGKGGNVVENGDCLAKILETGKISYYFVWLTRGNLYDPYGIDVLKRNSSVCKFVRVSKDVFESYFKYLKTKNRAHYNTANRMYRG